MTHHHARLVAVAIAAVSFSTPITAQQEPTPPATLEALVETLGGRVSQNEQGEVVEVYLSGSQVTDASLAHLTGLTALERLTLVATQVTDAGLAHLTGLTGLETLNLSETQVTDAGISELQKALPNCRILS
jgi:Leucine-rich repeat (LRR) protein